MIAHLVSEVRHALPMIPDEGDFAPLTIGLKKDGELIVIKLASFAPDSSSDYRRLRHVELSISSLERRTRASAWILSGTKNDLLNVPEEVLKQKAVAMAEELRHKLRTF